MLVGIWGRLVDFDFLYSIDLNVLLRVLYRIRGDLFAATSFPINNFGSKSLFIVWKLKFVNIT